VIEIYLGGVESAGKNMLLGVSESESESESESRNNILGENFPVSFFCGPVR
jgi:hypothetical protein